MNLGPISKNTSTVEVEESKDGLWLRDGEWEGLMPYEDFPQFRKMPPDEVAKVEKPESERYSWPNLGLVVDRSTIEDSHFLWRDLRNMRYVALGLLVLMGVVFIIASVSIDRQYRPVSLAGLRPRFCRSCYGRGTSGLVRRHRTVPAPPRQPDYPSHKD